MLLKSCKAAFRITIFSFLIPFLAILSARFRRLPPPLIGPQIVIEQRIACSARSIARKLGPSVVTAFAKKVNPSSLNLNKISLFANVAKKASDLSLIAKTFSEAINTTNERIALMTLRASLNYSALTEFRKEMSKKMLCLTKKLGQVPLASSSPTLFAVILVDPVRVDAILSLESELCERNENFNKLQPYVPRAMEAEYSDLKGIIGIWVSYKPARNLLRQEYQLAFEISSRIDSEIPPDEMLLNSFTKTQQRTDSFREDMLIVKKSVSEFESKVGACY